MEMENEITRPAATVNHITGISGKKYLIHDSVSAGRYSHLTRIEAEMHTSHAIQDTVKTARKAWEFFNKSEFANGVVTLNNIINEGERAVNQLPDRMLLYCSLFINSEDENVGEWNEAQAAEKIADWKMIDIRFFLACIVRFQTHFISDYDTKTPNVLEVENLHQFQEEAANDTSSD